MKFTYQPLSSADGTPADEPPSDATKWVIPAQYIPPGFVSQGHGDIGAESINARGLAMGTADPQATLSHLQQIQFLGGRHQQWAAPATKDGLIPVIDILHAVFQASPGAVNFLRNPAVNGSACVREEPGPSIGQETRHFQFSAPVPLPGGGTATESGHEVIWRCRRVVISVTEVGAPGQFTQGMVDDLARNIQSLFVKTDPCS